MAYRVIIQPKAQKQLRKIPKTLRRKIHQVLEFLKEEPLAGKKMIGELKGMYSVRAWPYRIIYLVEKKKVTVFVLAIGHRQGVYK